jgi:hypothetical protein
MKRLIVVAAVLPCAAILIGCGGGGSTTAISNTGNPQTYTYGDISTRSAGTVNPPVSAGALNCVVTGVAGAVISSVVLNDPTPTIAESEIAFLRNGSIYTASPDGTILTPFNGLVSVPGTGMSWQLGGSGYFVFTSTAHSIYFARNTGILLGGYTSGATDQDPTWSYPGTIAFSRLNGTTGKWQISEDTIATTKVTNLSNSSANDGHPSFSTLAGNLIAFDRTDSTGTYICTMTYTGASQTNISGTNVADSEPSWSPTTTTMAFVNAGSIYTMSANGTNRTQLTTPPSGQSDSRPTWSPDGKQIAFARATAVDSQIWVMNYDGSNQTVVTYGSMDTSPSWSPFFSSRTFIGTAGTLGTSAAGFLFARNGSVVTSLVAFNATTPDGATVTTDPSVYGTNVVFTIATADALTSLNYVNGYGPPVSVISASVPAATGAVVDFDAQTGRVADLLPYEAQKSVKAPTSQVVSGVRVFTGRFVGVYDSTGRNIAPQGAHEVRLDSKTGAVLSAK